MNCKPQPEIIGPDRTKTPRETRFRLAGPYWVHGMRVWRLFDLHEHKQIGMDCMSFQDAKRQLYDLAIGKTAFYFGGVPFKRTKG
jgi:hypothetical protein